MRWPVVRNVLRGWAVAALVALPASLWGQEVVPISTDIPECSVRLREVLSLGAFDDPGGISDPSQITRLESGEYALVSWQNGPEIMVFDSAGEYRRSLGRAGEGPGEFLDPGLGRLRTAPDGNLLVLDPSLGRITRLSAAGDALQTVDMGSLAFNFLPPGPPGPGYPLDDPYPSVIGTLRIRDGLVWIGTMVVDLEWAEYGEPSMFEQLDLTRLIDTVIEVIDPSTGDMIARAVHDERLTWTGDGSFLYSVREDGLVPRAVLFSPSFVGRECPPSGG